MNAYGTLGIFLYYIRCSWSFFLSLLLQEEFSEDMVRIIQSLLFENEQYTTRKKQANSVRSIFIKVCGFHLCICYLERLWTCDLFSHISRWFCFSSQNRFQMVGFSQLQLSCTPQLFIFKICSLNRSVEAKSASGFWETWGEWDWELRQFRFAGLSCGTIPQ